MPKRHAQTAYEYLDQHGASSGRALTKAEHDALVEKKGRPATDPGYRQRRHRNADLGPDNGGNVTIRRSEEEDAGR